MTDQETPAKNILIIEDDEAILTVLKDDLTYEGFRVTIARDGREGLDKALNRAFDLIILDILLPLMNGFEVCKKLREAGVAIPILMLTAAKTQEIDKVTGFELGADDYVTKPFGARELMARIKALLRRSESKKEKEARDFRFGDVWVDFKSWEITKKGKLIHLTPFEFNLLKFLIARRGDVVTRDEILDAVWNEAIVSPRTVEPHIAHLRQKLEDDPSRPRYIVGVHGIGYKFVT